MVARRILLVLWALAAGAVGQALTLTTPVSHCSSEGTSRLADGLAGQYSGVR
jgi:hypothetical protein